MPVEDNTPITEHIDHECSIPHLRLEGKRVEIEREFIATVKDYVREKGKLAAMEALCQNVYIIEFWQQGRHLPWPALQKVLIKYMRSI